VKSEDHSEAQEKKADHFIPQGVCWLDDGGDYVARELRANPDCLVFPHAPIVTNGRMGRSPLLRGP
jgi:hypothetical protein